MPCALPPVLVLLLLAAAAPLTRAIAYDDCLNARLITAPAYGITWTTVGATNDGPNDDGECNPSAWGAPQMDMWFDIGVQCTGTLTLDTCGMTSYDNALAVYQGGTAACTPSSLTSAIVCSDLTPGCALNSVRVDVPVVQGERLLVQVGGYASELGTGTMDVEIVCDPTNECTQGTHTCAATATCWDEPDGFSCTCWPGYTGDGETCVDVDECAQGTDSCGVNTLCVNTAGAYSCPCQNGYAPEIAGNGCADVNECSISTHNCAPTATCINTVGSFLCDCGQGYHAAPGQCLDDNECAPGGGAACHADAVCTNTPGGYSCACAPGFDGDGVTSCRDNLSLDVDECEAGTHHCSEHATCANVVSSRADSYNCTCNKGFKGDGVECQPASVTSVVMALLIGLLTLATLGASAFLCTSFSNANRNEYPVEDIEEEPFKEKADKHRWHHHPSPPAASPPPVPPQRPVYIRPEASSITPVLVGRPSEAFRLPIPGLSDQYAGTSSHASALPSPPGSPRSCVSDTADTLSLPPPPPPAAIGVAGRRGAMSAGRPDPRTTRRFSAAIASVPMVRRAVAKRSRTAPNRQRGGSPGKRQRGVSPSKRQRGGSPSKRQRKASPARQRSPAKVSSRTPIASLQDSGDALPRRQQRDRTFSSHAPVCVDDALDLASLRTVRPSASRPPRSPRSRGS